MIQPPKPPTERVDPQMYSMYLNAYGAYIDACIASGKEASRDNRAKLYSDVAKAKLAPPVKTGVATAPPSMKGPVQLTPATTPQGLKGKAKRSEKTVPPPVPAKAGQGKVPRGNHAKNLRRERRRLAERIADKQVSLKPVHASGNRELEVRKVMKLAWPQCKLVPSNLLPICFAGLKDVPSVCDKTVRWVASLSADFVASGECVNGRDLVLPNGDIILQTRREQQKKIPVSILKK